MKSTTHNHAISWLKLILSLFVVFGHYYAIDRYWFDDSLSENLVFKILAQFGRESAILFIFLSGFYSVNGIFKRRHKGLQRILARYKRFAKIYTPAVFIGISLDLIGLSLYENNYSLPFFNYIVSDRLTVIHFIGNVLLLEPLLVDSIGTNVPLWTIAYLFQFFVMDVVIQYFVSKRFYLAKVIVAVLLLGITDDMGLFYIVYSLGQLVSIRCEGSRYSFYVAPLLSVILFVMAALLSNLVVACVFVVLSSILFMQSRFPEDIKPIDDNIGFGIYVYHLPICALVSSVIQTDFSYFVALLITFSVSFLHARIIASTSFSIVARS